LLSVFFENPPTSTSFADTLQGDPALAAKFAECFDTMQDTALDRLLSPLW
jgi:hypothetical protein